LPNSSIITINDLAVRFFTSFIIDKSWFELIQWCIDMDTMNRNDNFLQTLLKFFRRHNISGYLDTALFELARKSINEERYEDALDLIDKALLISEKAEDSPFIKSVLVYRETAAFLSSSSKNY